MKILAIDSSGLPACAAIVEDGTLLAEFSIQYKKTHSQTLLPMIDEISKIIELDKESLDAVAVAGGPGSFTGLRIGSATAKGIGLALGKKLVHVPTLEGMACSFYGSGALICPMMDARRSQVFAGVYTFIRSDCTEEGAFGDVLQYSLKTVLDQVPVDVEELCEKLNAYSAGTGKEVILMGDGAAAYRTLLSERLTVPYMFAPVNLNAQKASSVAVRALQMLREGKTESAADHRPDYLRVSQAERVREEKRIAAKRSAAQKTAPEPSGD